MDENVSAHIEQILDHLKSQRARIADLEIEAVQTKLVVFFLARQAISILAASNASTPERKEMALDDVQDLLRMIEKFADSNRSIGEQFFNTSEPENVG